MGWIKVRVYLVLGLFLTLLVSCTLQTSMQRHGSDSTAPNESGSPPAVETPPPSDPIQPTPPLILPKPFYFVLKNPLTTPNSVATIDFQLMNVEVGEQIKIYSDSMCTTEVASGTSTSTTFDVQVTSLSAGGHSFFATRTSPVGVVSSCTSDSLYYLNDGTFSTISFQNIYSPVTEGSGLVNLQVNMTPSKSYPVKVRFTLDGSTAATGVHHDLTTREITILAGQTSANITFNVLENTDSAGRKFMYITLLGTDSAKTTFAEMGKEASVYFSDNDSTSNSIIQVSAGRQHFCGINNLGALACWGGNSNGQVGNGGTTTQYQPNIIDTGTVYSQVSGGGEHTCGITNTNALRCWGLNTYGQLGDGTTTQSLTPITINSGTSYSFVSAGTNHTCAISGGALYCWGANWYGQIGNSSTTNVSIPTLIDSGVSYLTVAAGGDFTCGITTLNVLKCWGRNGSGQLGDGSGTQRTSPFVINSGTSYSALATSLVGGSGGSDHTCAITIAGQMKCWGVNLDGNLGIGTYSYTIRNTPQNIDVGVIYTKVLVGTYTSCGVTNTNQLKCWGHKTQSFGSNSISSSPVVSLSTNTFNSLAINNTFCGASTSGALLCWDYVGYSGSLSNNLVSTVPKLIHSETTYRHLMMGYRHACGITTDGEMRCWGSQYQFGATYNVGDSTSFERFSPTIIDSGTKYVSGGRSVSGFSCFLTEIGQIKCWGENGYGNLGVGDWLNKTVPTLVDSGKIYKSVETGVIHTCAITHDDRLKCWGHNGNGRLGNGSPSDLKFPMTTDPAFRYSMVSPGDASTCGITLDGTLKCWGNNDYGQIGDGTTDEIWVPITIDPSVKYKFVSASAETYACGITTENKLRCWGTNWSGNLGDGTTTDSFVPKTIDPSEDYKYVMVSPNETTCAITINGDLKCWGWNLYGTVGNGTTNPVYSPVVIDAGVKYKSLSAPGSTYTQCGLTESGQLKCWGQSGASPSLWGGNYRYDIPIFEWIF